jgi:hypothetical protein
MLALGAIMASPAIVAAQKKAVPKDGQDSIVITFKDGHSQRFHLAEVERIEFESAELPTASSSFGHFLGRWKVGDGSGSWFYITLSRDGRAYKTIGSYHGSWEVVGDEARITWDDGWRDVIRKAGNRYEKAAFRPGTDFMDSPDNIASARAMDPI